MKKEGNETVSNCHQLKLELLIVKCGLLMLLIQKRKIILKLRNGQINNLLLSLPPKKKKLKNHYETPTSFMGRIALFANNLFADALLGEPYDDNRQHQDTAR